MSCRWVALVFLVWLSPTQFAWSQSAWPVEFKKVENGQTTQTLSIRKKQRWVWVQNSEGARVLKSKIAFEAPVDPENEKPKAENANTRLGVKGRIVIVETDATEDTIHFGDPPALSIHLKTVPVKNNVIDENCKAVSLKFEVIGTPAPFFLGVTCTTKNKDVNLHLTFPNDVELSQSSLFESLGKGENYRVYELKRIDAASSELGRFEFRFKGKSYTYALASIKGEAQATKVPEADFALGLGAGQLKLASTDANASDTKPIVRFQLLPHEFWGHLGGGANVETAVGFSNSAKSISYIQLALYTYYRLKLSSSLEFHPRLYYVISNQSSGSGVGYQTNQVGVGLYSMVRFSERSSVRLELMVESIGSQVIKTHDLIDLSYFQRSAKSSSGWGFGVQSQTYGVVDAVGNKRKFDQMIGYGIYAF
jgi:hypothetical protein